MAPPRAKGKGKEVEQPEEESEEEESETETEEDSEDEEDLDGSDDDEEEIMVDFEFQDPKETDFHGLKALLKNYLDGAEFSSSELCDFIIKQNTVGTVIKAQGAGDENDPIAVMSVVNLTTNKDAPYVKELAAWLKGKCPKDLRKKLDGAFGDEGVGLIINERIINVPPETAPPMVNQLFDEIEWATQDEPTEELKNSFKFKKYLFVTRLFRDDEPEEEAGKKRKRGGEPVLMHIRPEDEFFQESGDWSFMWKSKDTEDKDDIQDLKPMRLCMLVDASAVPTVRDALKKVFG